MKTLDNKNIVIGVTGGIAVYKVVDVVSRLKKLGANIDVIMTKSAQRFVTPLTFQALSQNFVTIDMFAEPKKWEVEHISLAQKADLFLIAPATANIIGKVANGIADDMLSTTIMACKSRVVFAPAMNTNMFQNPILHENIVKLKGLEYEFITPASGRLACGDYGKGRLAEPKKIVDYIVESFKCKKNISLEGKKIIVTAGPTIEPLDPVRYLTNHSSGKMGYAIAKEANNRGAKVILVSGPTSLSKLDNIEHINVQRTSEMLTAIENHFKDCDALIKAAAPLDYRPKTVKDAKMKKDNDEIVIKLVKNPDILKHFGHQKQNQVLVGFAAETDNVLEYAKKKIIDKNLDFIVANNVLREGSGFKEDTNIATIIDKKDNIESYNKMHKEELSKIIISKVEKLLNNNK